jgi:homoserine kinase
VHVNMQLQNRTISYNQTASLRESGVIRPRTATRATSSRLPIVAGGKVYLDPVQSEATAFAPATVANLGPGFDWLGCAVEVGFIGSSSSNSHLL